MRRFEVHAVCEIVFPNIEANSVDEAVSKVATMIPMTIKNGQDAVTCGITIDDLFAKSYDLMDTSNNHDPKLVERINRAWINERGAFIDIVDMLIERDTDMMSNPKLHMTEAEVRCREYCQNIADNRDLKTILVYCKL